MIIKLSLPNIAGIIFNTCVNVNECPFYSVSQIIAGIIFNTRERWDMVQEIKLSFPQVQVLILIPVRVRKSAHSVVCIYIILRVLFLIPVVYRGFVVGESTY